MGLHKKSLEYYENNHNLKFPEFQIKVLKRVDKNLYFSTEFGECKMNIGNIGRAMYSCQCAVDKKKYLINRLKKLHGNLYDFSLIKTFNKTNEKVSLVCKEHGIFKKVINTLLTKKNVYCPHCYNNKIRSLNKISNTFDFIKKSKIIHNDKYDYSFTDYTKAKNFVDIICKKHGKFLQTPDAHLAGRGCWECSFEIGGWNFLNWEKKAKVSKNFDSFKVYIIRCWNEEEEFYKIGKTYRTVLKRFNKNNLPYNFVILKTIEGTALEMSKLELKLKIINKKNKYIPKIKFGGMQECFTTIKKIN